MLRSGRSARKRNGVPAAQPSGPAAAVAGDPTTLHDNKVEMQDASSRQEQDQQQQQQQQQQPSKPMTIEDDDLCPICHLLLYRPVRTTCAHSLCQSCMAHWADVSSAAAQMTIVPLSLTDPLPDARQGLVEARCPMCRTVTTAVRDAARERALRRKYPGVWAERGAEEGEAGEAAAAAAAAAAGGGLVGGEGGVQTLTVFVGNTHKLLEGEDATGNCHEWTFFVRLSDTEVVEEVQILLHPTFRPPRVIRSAPPYQISRIGWGYFKIQAYVILKAGYSWISDDAEAAPDGAEKGMLPLEWMLSFEGEGSMGRCRLKIKNEVLADESSSSDDGSEWEE